MFSLTKCFFTHDFDQLMCACVYDDFFSIISSIPIDSVLRNDSTRVIQPEVIYRSDNLGQTSSNTIAGSSNNAIDRKGSVAIGQSVFYTDYPPQDYGNAGKLNCNQCLALI